MSTTPSSKPKPQGSSIIFLNAAHHVLLCLRDDKDTIPFPNQWDLLGGGLEPGETPLECIVREMREEIEFELRDPIFFKSYDLADRVEHLFWQHSKLEIATTPLHEGQRLRWFSEQEIRAMRPDELAFAFRDLLVDFYNDCPFATLGPRTSR